MTLAAEKATLRTRAMAARAAAFGAVDTGPAMARLAALVADHSGVAMVSAYAAMRTEIDPEPALQALHERGYGICLPVVAGPGRALEFRAWIPGTPLVPGAFGAAIPPEAPAVVPDLVIAPLLAFDARLYRLGYGGGFYDRTLAALRVAAAAPAIGLAFAAQQVPLVPIEITDVRLDAVVTEEALHLPA